MGDFLFHFPGSCGWGIDDLLCHALRGEGFFRRGDSFVHIVEDVEFPHDGGLNLVVALEWFGICWLFDYGGLFPPPIFAD